MYKLELDLHLYFDPPMEDRGGGIVVTRTIELPFAPSPGLMVYGQDLDECPEPGGWPLKDLTWDIDREVFLATTSLSSHGMPMAMIPDVLQGWLARGWRLGSYMETYPEPDDDAEEAPDPAAADEEDLEDEMDRWPSLPPSKRPKAFNRLMRTLVRAMSERYNNLAVAYAMDQTKRYFDEHQLKQDTSRAAERWRQATRAFEELPPEQQSAWQEHVENHYPRLDRLVKEHEGW
ncbi:hypothetical protein ACERK3_01405 [Phycisphaerales bacterium AB-hyl4]|uniref:Uncharacterized protein n=1 Tax=Natronomicrosphaera hydrolytica TaxID=3242702 RepID=A0ABV4U277_9BACT